MITIGEITDPCSPPFMYIMQKWIIVGDMIKTLLYKIHGISYTAIDALLENHILTLIGGSIALVM